MDDIVERLVAMAARLDNDRATIEEAIILIRTHALDPDHPLAID